MFKCIKCGLCCQHIDVIPQLKTFDDGSGRCIHLQEDNLCEIYEHRPDICNVDKQYECFYKDMMSRSEFDDLNTKGCHILWTEYGK